MELISNDIRDASFANATDQYPVGPGMWIRTEEGERHFFRRYSSTGHWGFFSETSHLTAVEYKLPLAGLKPWHKDRRT